MEKSEILDINNVTSWKKDQVFIKEVLTILNGYFSSTPNASGLEYLSRFDIEWSKAESKIFASTKSKMARIREDAELWMKNIYQSKWMQGEDFITKIISYTTYIYTL